MRLSTVCRIIQNTFIAFVVATLWPKPHLNQDSTAMGTTYAAVLFFSLVRNCSQIPELGCFPYHVHERVLFTVTRMLNIFTDMCCRVLAVHLMS